MTIRILSLQPTLTVARVAKRIDMLQRAGCKLESMGFERNLSTGRLPNCPLESLGPMPHGRYFSRVLKMAWRLPKVRAGVSRNDLVYAFNPDMALLALAAGAGLGKPVVLEVADIRPVQVAGGPLGLAFRKIDKWVTEACRLLVLTSDGYASYYKDWLAVATPRMVIENKLDAPFAAAVRARLGGVRAGAPLAGRPLRIGWFGLLRDQWSLAVLEALTRARPGGYSVLLAGQAHNPLDGKEFLRLVANNPAFEFRGPYRHPEHLPDLYADVDVIMAGKPPTIPEAWSRTNRLYDACLFGKPLIVRAGSGDAALVQRHGIGAVVQAEDIAAAAEEIAAVEVAQWEGWRAKAEALPPEVHTISSEASDLQAVLVGLAAEAKQPGGKPSATASS